MEDLENLNALSYNSYQGVHGWNGLFSGRDKQDNVNDMKDNANYIKEKGENKRNTHAYAKLNNNIENRAEDMKDNVEDKSNEANIAYANSIQQMAPDFTTMIGFETLQDEDNDYYVARLENILYCGANYIPPAFFVKKEHCPSNVICSVWKLETILWSFLEDELLCR